MEEFNPNKVIDILAYKKSLEEVSTDFKLSDFESIEINDLKRIVGNLVKLNKYQSDIIGSMIVDLGMLVQSKHETQQQLMMISGQAFIGISLLKEKGIASAEEIESMWKKILVDNNIPIPDLPEVEKEFTSDLV